MAEQKHTHVTFAAAKKTIKLVRKYNQASTDVLGFQLNIAIDKQEEPHINSYTNFEKQFFLGDQKSDFNIIS